MSIKLIVNKWIVEGCQQSTTAVEWITVGDNEEEIFQYFVKWENHY